MIYVISISDTKNIDTFRRKLNVALSGLAAGYGSALPSASAANDGKLFAVGAQLYQNQAGSWVAL
jgi:hypothetical protein